MTIIKLPKLYHPDFARPKIKPFDAVELEDKTIVSYLIHRGRDPDSILDLANNNFVSSIGSPQWNSAGDDINFSGLESYDVIGERITSGVTGYPFVLAGRFRTTESGPLTVAGLAISTESLTVYGIQLNNGNARIAARNTDFQSASSTETFNDGKFHDMLGVFISDTEKLLYVDGLLVATLTENVTYNTSVDVFSVGRFGDSSPSGEFIGDLKDVYLKRGITTAAEALFLARNPYSLLKPVNDVDYFTVSAVAPSISIPVIMNHLRNQGIS